MLMDENGNVLLKGGELGQKLVFRFDQVQRGGGARKIISLTPIHLKCKKLLLFVLN